MKTWRQGNIGKLTLPNSNILFIKCLKYPLAIFYDEYDLETKIFGSSLFKAFIELAVLKQIEKLDNVALSREDKNLGSQFEMHYFPGTSDIKKMENRQSSISNEIIELNMKGLCSIDDLLKKYQAIKNVKL